MIESICSVIAFGNTLDYWNLQTPKPRVENGFLVWDEHKFQTYAFNCVFSGDYCSRCGIRKKNEDLKT